MNRSSDESASTVDRMNSNRINSTSSRHPSYNHHRHQSSISNSQQTSQDERKQQKDKVTRSDQLDRKTQHHHQQHQQYDIDDSKIDYSTNDQDEKYIDADDEPSSPSSSASSDSLDPAAAMSDYLSHTKFDSTSASSTVNLYEQRKEIRDAWRCNNRLQVSNT